MAFEVKILTNRTAHKVKVWGENVDIGRIPGLSEEWKCRLRVGGREG